MCLLCRLVELQHLYSELEKKYSGKQKEVSCVVSIVKWDMFLGG